MEHNFELTFFQPPMKIRTRSPRAASASTAASRERSTWSAAGRSFGRQNVRPKTEQSRGRPEAINFSCRFQSGKMQLVRAYLLFWREMSLGTFLRYFAKRISEFFLTKI